ncbi:hypothetical protein TNCV_4718061 [Trichonephila clavipes]|nr:hypothetical protein TNCV_4718061 [Trichonephila clavipes]
MEKTIQLAPQFENQNHRRRKTTQLSRRKTTQLGTRNETTRLNSEEQLSSTEKTKTELVNRNETTQLYPAVVCLQPPSAPGTKQLESSGGNSSTRHQERNNSTQQEKTTQLVNRNETTQLSIREQLNSSAGTTACKQLNSALPSTACTAFTAESAFSTYSQTLAIPKMLQSVQALKQNRTSPVPHCVCLHSPYNH